MPVIKASLTVDEAVWQEVVHAAGVWKMDVQEFIDAALATGLGDACDLRDWRLPDEPGSSGDMNDGIPF